MSEVRHRIRLRPGRERAVLAGHPWVFSGAAEEVHSLPGAVDGDLCDVTDAAGTWIARGTLHARSQILCRILTWREEPIDTPFFRRRVAQAAALRGALETAAETDAYRLVNAEGDRLPGLIVDRYADVLSVQCLTIGMDRLRDLWLEALRLEIEPAAIVDATGSAPREPGLPERREVLHGEIPSVAIPIRENGHRFQVPIFGGQKTGFYLDQRENRALFASIAEGKDVLDGHAYTGAFGVYAGAAGARRVVLVESSEPALDRARRHWAENDLAEERAVFVHADIGRHLRETHEEFDAIVLDPPPFARTRGSVDRAARAYKDVNLWALRRLRPGGFLMTFSCSQHVDADLFQKILFGAARDARASLQWARRLGAGIDHPVHLDHPQGEYLKGMLLRLLDRREAP